MSRHDVVVIGAGAAGLACAHKLRANGLDVVVLEARERLGGRIHTQVAPTGEQVEVGAQVVHGEHAFTWNVVRARGLVAEPLDVGGDFVFAVEGQRLTGAGLPRGVIAPWVVETLLTRHTGTAARLCAGTSGLTRTLALEWLAQVWAADPDDLSVDGMAAVRRDWRSGRQDFLLVDGYRRVPEVLAAGLDVRLGKPVRHVAWSPAGVQVDDLEARAAVITSPPQATSRGIVFDPPLPAEKRKAVRELTFGPAAVAVVSLTEPAPESAWCLTLGRTGGFLRTTRDRKTLTLCCKGSTARRVPPGEWDADLVGELAGPVLPWLRGSTITDLRVVDWTADPWALGAFGYPRDGWLDACAAWANPVGKTLFFAGDSTCGSAHPSSVHGALESGVRASAEVLEGVGHVR